MNRLMRVLSIVSFTAALAAPGWAQPAKAPIPPDKEAAIRELMAVTGAGKLGQQVTTQLMTSLKATMPQLPEAFWTNFAKEVNPEEMVNMVVPIYAAHFSTEEVRQLTAFYRTPLGQKVTAEMPRVMQESMAAGQQWGARIGQRAYEEATKQQKKPGKSR